MTKKQLQESHGNLKLQLDAQQKVIQQLQDRAQQLQDTVQQLQDTAQHSQVMIDKLQQQVETLLRQLYGKKSERIPKPAATNQETTEKETEPSAVISTREKSDVSTRANGRRPLPKHFKRTKVKHELSESERECQVCGRQMAIIGKEVAEQLDYVPAQLIVIEHVRYKYGCSCHRCIKIAPMPAQPIDKGLPGAGLLAEVLVSKYQDALPLYRQEKRWQRLGVELPRSTLCDWVAHCAVLLEPLVVRMKEEALMGARKIHTDDTPFPIQAEGKTHTGRLWVYVGGGGPKPVCTIYDYSKSRSQKAPQQFLQTYQGYLQADAYAGYNALYQSGAMVEVACWAHARRKFFDITQAVQAPSLADDALIFIGHLYEIEQRSKSFTPLQRKYYRKYYAKPILKRFKRWLVKNYKTTLPKAPIHLAIAYTLNHWRALCHYLREGYLDIDNNAAERAIKPFVIGRKNYLFAGSHEGAKRAAIIYSMIETCKQHQVNTFDYLKDVLTRLPTQKMSQIDELLPYYWQQAPR